MDRKTHSELHRLLSALLDGTLSPEQQSQLGDLLQQDAAARDLYLAYFQMHADLSLRGGSPLPVVNKEPGQPGPAATTPAGEPLSRTATPRSRLRRRLFWGGLGLAGVAAALWLVLTLGQRPPQRRPVASHPPEPQDSTVAVLLQAPGAVWEQTGLPTWAGAPLYPGRLKLKSGLAHIEFYSGAMIILQGPAELQLISRTEAHCASGKLRAVVPPQAQGFTITSPKLDLVDRGTEFGLEVSASGKTEVHVFQGQVDLYNPGANRTAAPARELKTGGGVRVAGPGFDSIPLNPGAFVTPKELIARSDEATRVRQKEWLRVSDVLKKDPSLVVYYTFDNERPWERVLRDHAAKQQAPPHDGAVVGCIWGNGRWPGKQGLEFKRVSDRVRFRVTDEFESLTLMAWVRIDGLPNRNNSLMMTDGWEPGECHWQIGDNGTLILGIQGNPKGRGAHYHAVNAVTPERFGQWLHLAVVYDRDGEKVTHYLDGHPVAQQPIQFDIPLRISDAQLGNWNLATHRNNTPIRFLSGCMDEFLLFGRALSDEEIERHYTSGRP